MFDELAEWFAEHFLPALVERPKWLKSFSLKEGKKAVDLTKVIEGASQWVEKFAVGNYQFRAVCYSVSSTGKDDMVKLVAGGRVVYANTRPLEFYLPHLANISQKRPSLVLIYSAFFDEHVNDARNGVSFAEEGDGLLLGLTAPQFREACAGALKGSLGKALEKSVHAFKERIAEVVAKEAPYYRPLLLGFFGSKEFTGLSTSSRDEEILSALDTYKRRDAIKLKQESRRIAKVKSGDGAEDYVESARKLADQIETQKKVALAEVSEALLKRLEETGFTPSPTGNGAFWVTNRGRYYIEYISLPKLLEDAQARNVAFFKQLGLEP